MELAKNKASGKLFVVLDDTGGPTLLVITPEGKKRSLERRLFELIEMTDPAEALSKQKLTKSQVDLYLEYLDE